MKRSLITSLGAALGLVATRPDRTETVVEIGRECPVCDHPFGDSAHMCLASDALSVAS
jgi:hypothetical protein